MSAEIDLEFIQQRYEKMSDEEITRVLVNDVKGLTPEALVIVKQEIRCRKLDENIFKGVDAQQKELSEYEIDTYCKLIQKLPCPYANNSSENLNATIVEDIKSFIFLTHSSKKLIIASPIMLDRAHERAIANSLILGWWSFHGIFKTPIIVFKNLKNKKRNHQIEPTDALIDFVKMNVGFIEAYKNDAGMLSQLIVGIK